MIGRRGFCRGGDSKTGCTKDDCEGDAQGIKLAIREQPRGGGHHGHEIATATAKKVTVAAAKIIWGAIAKATGAPRAAPFVVIR